MFWPAAWQSTTFVTDDAQSSPHGSVISANETSPQARHAGKKLYMETCESFEVMVATDLHGAGGGMGKGAVETFQGLRT